MRKLEWPVALLNRHFISTQPTATHFFPDHAGDKLLAAKQIPEHVLNDDDLLRETIVAVGECVAKDMTASEWRKFAIRHGLQEKTVDRFRFLRSLSWDDNDHEGMVIELIEHVLPAQPKAFFDLFERSGVQNSLRKSHPNLLASWFGEPDHLVEAVAIGVTELDAVANVIDLSEHRSRIQAALPGDPKLAIGVTKDMLEATMRTILDARAKSQDKNADFPTLVTACLVELGLTPNTPPTSDAEKHVRAIASAAKKMIEVANEFRNSAGSGHGRIVGKEIEVSADDASLVASSGFILAAWLLKRHRSARNG